MFCRDTGRKACKISGKRVLQRLLENFAVWHCGLQKSCDTFSLRKLETVPKPPSLLCPPGLLGAEMCGMGCINPLNAHAWKICLLAIIQCLFGFYTMGLIKTDNGKPEFDSNVFMLDSDPSSYVWEN